MFLKWKRLKLWQNIWESVLLLLQEHDRPTFASGNRISCVFSKLSANSSVTQLSVQGERDPDVKSACAVTTPLSLNIKVSCGGCCWSNRSTISAIAQSNDSLGNKPSHHYSGCSALHSISWFSLSTAHGVWSSNWSCYNYIKMLNKSCALYPFASWSAQQKDTMSDSVFILIAKRHWAIVFWMS